MRMRVLINEDYFPSLTCQLPHPPHPQPEGGARDFGDAAVEETRSFYKTQNPKPKTQNPKPEPETQNQTLRTQPRLPKP